MVWAILFSTLNLRENQLDLLEEKECEKERAALNLRMFLINKIFKKFNIQKI